MTDNYYKNFTLFAFNMWKNVRIIEINCDGTLNSLIN